MDEIQYPILSEPWMRQRSEALDQSQSVGWKDWLDNIADIARYTIMGRGGIGKPRQVGLGRADPRREKVLRSIHSRNPGGEPAASTIARRKQDTPGASRTSRRQALMAHHQKLREMATDENSVLNMVSSGAPPNAIPPSRELQDLLGVYRAQQAARTRALATENQALKELSPVQRAAEALPGEGLPQYLERMRTIREGVPPPPHVGPVMTPPGSYIQRAQAQNERELVDGTNKIIEWMNSLFKSRAQ